MRASPCRAPAASATQKGSEQLTSAPITRRNRVKRGTKRWWDYYFFAYFLPHRLCFLLLIVVHFHDAVDLVTVSHLSFLIDLLRSSAPSFADVYVCVCARRKWAGTCNLIRFEMRKRRCQQATLPVIVILLKTPNDANQCSAICSSSLTICEQSKGQILCSPCAF